MSLRQARTDFMGLDTQGIAHLLRHGEWGPHVTVCAYVYEYGMPIMAAVEYEKLYPTCLWCVRYT